MHNLLQKNFACYLKNYKDFIALLIRPYLYTIPYFLFLKYSNDANNSKSFILISTLLVYIITCSVINPNFEIFKDVMTNKHINILLSKISFQKYILSFFIFWIIIINIQIITILIFYYVTGLLIIKNILFLIIIYLLLYINIFTLTIVLSYLTIKLKIFQYSSIITNIILLLSGSLFNVEVLPDYLKKIAYLSPFTYSIKIIRNIIIDSPFNVKKDVTSLIFLTIIYFCLGMLLYHKYLLPKIKSIN